MKPIDLIAVGCSLGGMNALETILGGLAPEFCVPIAIVQHRHKNSNEALPAYLSRVTHLRVVDVEHGQPIEQGFVYLAPADYHLLVEKGRFSLSIEIPVAYSRPSIDVFFESAADAYRDGLTTRTARAVRCISSGAEGRSLCRTPRRLRRRSCRRRRLQRRAWIRSCLWTRSARFWWSSANRGRGAWSTEDEPAH
jgi:hypothetical protein